MWLLWQLLSSQKKLVDDNFEYRLILEFEDKLSIDIDLNTRVPDNEHELWLRLVATKAPFDNVNVSNKHNASLCISGFIDLCKLLEREPLLSHIYLWTATSVKREQIYLETLSFKVACSLEKPKVRSLSANKNFIELYPLLSEDQSSDRYNQIEDQRIDSEGFKELLAIVRGEIDEDSVMSTPRENGDSIGSNLLEVVSKNSIQKVFLRQDLKDLVDGFNDWQRAHGQNELVDKLPESLISKMGNTYQIAFWTSGQGVSNMVRDDNPPRHTMVLGIIQRSSQQGIGYCIQRPTSLDKVWQHKKWHDIKYSDDEILEVVAIDSK